jgi:DeoR family transcriptional regulator, aga operon transcriptional repressor
LLLIVFGESMKRVTALSNTERQQMMLQFVEQHQRASTDEIIAHFNVSPATARRDLETLAQAGRLQRVHGGALALRFTPPEPPVLLRSNEQAEEKKRIAIMAAGLVADGETIFLGSGTTVLEVARLLRERHNLTVITNSLLVANELADVAGMAVILLGGLLRRSERSLLGHIAEQALAELRADKVVMGFRAIHEVEGLTSAYLQEAVIDRAILRISRQVIVVADHTKLGRIAAAFVAPITAVHTLVTDDQAAPAFVQAAAAQGVSIRLA